MLCGNELGIYSVFAIPMLTVAVWLIDVVALHFVVRDERRPRSLVHIAYLLVPFAAPTVALIATTLWFEANVARLLDEAVGYCDTLRPQLEEQRAAHGSYPEALPDVQSSTGRPLLLYAHDGWYESDGAHYSFQINTSRGLAFIGARFDSDEGRWLIDDKLGP